MIEALNIGCGRAVKASTEGEKWVNLDCEMLPGVDVLFDLEDCVRRRLPFKENRFDYIEAVHVVEHLEAILPIFQELWRVAKPGSSARIVLPYGSSDDAWEDPTHKRPWWRGSWKSLDARYYWRTSYGYLGDWELERLILKVPIDRVRGEPGAQILERIDRERNVVLEMEAHLRCVKPSRVADGQPKIVQNIELDVQE